MRRRVRARALAALLCGLAPLLAGGCNLFRPADPEPPAGGDVFIPDYSDPARVLTTLARALELKSEQAAYADGLADSIYSADQPFSARHDPADIAEVPPGTPIPSRWDKNRERVFYSRVVVQRDTTLFMLFQFTPGLTDSLGANQQVLYRTYTMFVGAAAGDTIARGRADLRFVKLAGQGWRLLHWVDRRDPSTNPNLRTFGWLRLVTQ